jgi:TM2 domain-containing membrane protein YozV
MGSKKDGFPTNTDDGRPHSNHLARFSIEAIIMNSARDTHLKSVGYLLWVFGFTGAHRFYYGKPITGTLWFFTLGLLGIGWLIDLLLIPGMDRQADLRYQAGRTDYTVAWILLTFLGLLGIHRFYLGKIMTGLLYLLTGGLLGLGVLYDFWTLNEQVSQLNHRDLVLGN